MRVRGRVEASKGEGAMARGTEVEVEAVGVGPRGVGAVVEGGEGVGTPRWVQRVWAWRAGLRSMVCLRVEVEARELSALVRAAATWAACVKREGKTDGG